MQNQIFTAFFALFLLLFSASFSQSSAQIRGKLLKSDGTPLAYTEIEMVPVESDKIVIDPRMNVTTSASGLFTFRLPQGKYTLSINFDENPSILSPFVTTFYPQSAEREKAEVFTIDEKTPPQTIVFRAPPALGVQRVSGRVVNEKGNPAFKAWIGLRGITGGFGVSFGVVKTDKAGNFSLNAFSDRQYQIRAIMFEKDPEPFMTAPPVITGIADSGIFILDAQTKPFKLVLKQQTDNYNEVRDKYLGFLERNYFQEQIFGINH
ncbi:MAG: carboxypeptidase-like regulatory domain-containing protein [Pyrinomonadaceae bacterium]|nr:carboxypeptidase-like regulatory domain-containing protein [Pyrinomonadaceae bacterium]